MSLTRVVIIAKAPIPGFAKTRLIPALGAEGAAQLARRMLEHAVQIALAADIGPVEMCVTPEPNDPVWSALGLPAALNWSAQCPGDLGARMGRAVRQTVEQGERVLLTGTDCPMLTTLHLRAAAAALDQHDAALTPTADGGYVLLGLKRFHPSLFDDMPWSTDAVAAETLSRLAQIGWSVHTQEQLHDVDEAADLQWLPSAFPFDIAPARLSASDKNQTLFEARQRRDKHDE